MEEHEADLIDYLNVVWKRKYLIIGGTLVTAAAAFVVGLSMPKTYEVSRTLKIGKLPDSIHEGSVTKGKVIEGRETVIGRLKDHRVIKMAIEKIHLGLTPREMETLISIDTSTNPDVRYTVRAHDSQDATRIADLLANYIIKTPGPFFKRGMQIAKEYRVGLAAKICSLEAENLKLKKMLKGIIEAPDVDPTAVVLLEAGIGERERNLADVRRELNEVRLSHLGLENTSVIAADAPLQHPVKPRVKLMLFSLVRWA